MELLLMILLLLAIQWDVTNQCFVCLSNLSVPAHCSSIVSQMISVISHCIHIRSSYTWYLWEMMRFFATHAKPHGRMNYHFSVHKTTINDVTDVHKCSGCANLASIALYLSAMINKYHKSFTLTQVRTATLHSACPWVACPHVALSTTLRQQWYSFIVTVIELLGYVNMKA